MKSLSAIAVLSISSLAVTVPATAQGDVAKVKSELAIEAVYGEVARPGYAWGAKRLDSFADSITKETVAIASSSNRPWSQRSRTSDIADSGVAKADQTAYKWGIRSTLGQSAYKWGIRSSADQSAYKWGIRSSADQSAYKWGIRSNADQSAYKWGIRSSADQSAYKWGIRSSADQSAYKWGIRSSADQSAYKWGIR